MKKDSIIKFKKVLEKHYGKEVSEVVAEESLKNLTEFFEILIEIDQKQSCKISNT